jgi:hypothetical protein
MRPDSVARELLDRSSGFRDLGRHDVVKAREHGPGSLGILSAANSVEPTRSAKSTVASLRSSLDSGAAAIGAARAKRASAGRASPQFGQKAMSRHCPTSVAKAATLKTAATRACAD